MDCSSLFHCDLKDASVRIKACTEKELDTIEEELKTKNPRASVAYARLLVYRRDSERLLQFLTNRDIMVCQACYRFLKIGAVRKDLLKVFDDEQKFLDTLNNSCEVVKQALLEMLVWNKNRPENCLADRLYKNPSLHLNSQLKEILKQALSLELSVKENISNTNYLNLHHKELEIVALKNLYSLNTDLKNGQYKNSLDKANNEVNRLLSYIKRPYLKTEINGQTVHLFNVLIDIFNYVVTDATMSYFLQTFYNVKEYNSASTAVSSFKMAKFTGVDLQDFLRYYVINAPYFMVQKLNLMKYSRYWKWQFTVVITQACRAYKDEKLNRELVGIMVQRAMDTQSLDFWNRIRNVLTDEEFSLFLDQLLDSVKQTISQPKSSLSSILQFALDYLWQYVPYTNPKFAEVLNLLVKQFEMEIVLNKNEYLKYLQQEVPLDFNYNMLPASMRQVFTTVRKFESYICMKGSSILNKDDTYLRNSALNSIVQMAVNSRDVRCVLRCLKMITGMEAKSTDIRVNWSSHRELFSPDSLGLSSLSLENSGSAELAKVCRQNIVDLLLSWVQEKKGTYMVNPLCCFVLFLYFYASEYPEYEEEYCQMMKPIIGYFVNKKLQWSDAQSSSKSVSLPNVFSVSNERKRILQDKYHFSTRFNDVELPERKRHLIVENYMMGKANHLPKENSFGAHGLISFNDYFSQDLGLWKPMASKPLSLLLSFLDDDNTNRLYIAELFTYVVTSSLIDNHYETKTTTETKLPEFGIIVTMEKATQNYFVDYSVLDALFWNMDIPYKPYYPGYSALQTLMALEKTASSLKKYIDRQTSSVSFSRKDINSDTKTKSKVLSVMDQLQKNIRLTSTAIESDIYRYVIKEQTKTFAQSTNFINNVDFSESSLTWILKAMEQYDLFKLLGTENTQGLIRRLEGLSDSNLLLLSSLTLLRLQIAFQGAVMVISLNQSPNPLFKQSLVEQVMSIHPTLIRALTAQVLINNEIQYRGLIPEKINYTIKTTSPFLYAFLTSIRDNTVQSVKEMQDITPTTDENAEVKEVTLNFFDNAVIGRFVEILFYDRKTKYFFGSRLNGLVPFVKLLDNTTIISICQRLLLTTTFVPLVETIVNYCLLCIPAESPFFSKFIRMVLNSSKSMTVATILFFFRLSNHPMLAQSDMIKKAVFDIISTVITKKFDSESIYTTILVWIFQKLSNCPMEQMDSYLSYLKQLSSLDPNSTTTSSVITFIFGLTEALSKKDETLVDEEEQEQIAHIILSFGDDARIQKILNALAELIIAFNYSEPSFIAEQCKYVIHSNVIVKSDAFISRCQDVFETPADLETVIYICLYLFLVQPETAINRFVSYNDSMITQINDQDKDKRNDNYTTRDGNSNGSFNIFSRLAAICSNYPDTLLVRFVAHLPSSKYPFISVVPFANILSKYIGDKNVPIEQCSIDIDALVSDLKGTIQPWMYSDILNFCQLLTFSSELKEKMISEFKKQQSEVAALAALMVHPAKKEKTSIVSWIVGENVTNLFFVVNCYTVC